MKLLQAKTLPIGNVLTSTPRDEELFRERDSGHPAAVAGQLAHANFEKPVRRFLFGAIEHGKPSAGAGELRGNIARQRAVVSLERLECPELAVKGGGDVHQLGLRHALGAAFGVDRTADDARVDSG